MLIYHLQLFQIFIKVVVYSIHFIDLSTTFKSAQTKLLMIYLSFMVICSSL